MANVKHGNLTGARERWQHLRHFGKREFWKSERQAHKAAIGNELVAPPVAATNAEIDELMDWRDSTWEPDSETPNDRAHRRDGSAADGTSGAATCYAAGS